MVKIKSSEITPEHVYINRRDFLKSLGIVSASALVLAACGGQTVTPTQTSIPESTQVETSGMTDELVDEYTSYE